MIRKPNNLPLDANGTVNGILGRWLPGYRMIYAKDRGAGSNALIVAPGYLGLGDIVCAEPAIRYGIENFKGVTWSLATQYPGLFQHLPWKKVYSPEHGNMAELVPDNYWVIQPLDTTNQLADEFINHPLMGGVDFASLFMWKCILKNSQKEVKLIPTAAQYETAANLSQPNDVIVHAGKTWKSRTFPKRFWDTVTKTITNGGGRPVLVGDVVDGGRASTVDLAVEGCLDLRSKLTLMESVALLHSSKVLLTNDSSPLHMAASGDTWIGFISTVKPTDHLLHWRKGQYGWRMKDFALGRVSESVNVCPNQDKNVRFDEVDTVDLLKWLPDPVEYAEWALSKI